METYYQNKIYKSPRSSLFQGQLFLSIPLPDMVPRYFRLKSLRSSLQNYHSFPTFLTAGLVSSSGVIVLRKRSEGQNVES